VTVQNDRNDKDARRLRAQISNAQGHYLEGYLKAACEYYKQWKIAEVEQTPEPFRTTKTNRDGTFTGRFTSKAQPDFIGTLKGGKTIVFEAKYTSTDRIKQCVVTDTQEESLRNHHEMGAYAGVVAGVKEIIAFVPWEVWETMKERYGRKHMTEADLEPYRVKFNGSALFLDYMHENKSDLQEWELRNGREWYSRIKGES
jgi:recombination protein U